MGKIIQVGILRKPQITFNWWKYKSCFKCNLVKEEFTMFVNSKAGKYASELSNTKSDLYRLKQNHNYSHKHIHLPIFLLSKMSWFVKQQ